MSTLTRLPAVTWVALSPLLFAATVACNGDKGGDSGEDGSTDATDTDTDTDTDGGDDTGDTDTDTDTDTTPTGEPLGVVTAVHWPEDATYAEDAYLHAVFTTDGDWTAPLDPLGLLADQGVDAGFPWAWWAPPELGADARVDELRPDLSASSLETLDAGEGVWLGSGLEAWRTDVDGLVVYESQPAEEEALDIGEFDGGGMATLTVLGGDDIAELELDDAIAFPPPVTLTVPDDMSVIHVAGPDDDLEVRWTPAETSGFDVLVTLYGENFGHVYRVMDEEGELIVDADLLAGLGGDVLSVAVARLSEETAVLPEGDLLLRAMSEQWFYVVQVESLEFYPTEVETGSLVTFDLYIPPDGPVLDETDVAVDLGSGVFVDDVTVAASGLHARVRAVVDEDARTGGRTISIESGGETWTAAEPYYAYHPTGGADTCSQAGVGPAMRDGLLRDFRSGLSVTEVSDEVLLDCVAGTDFSSSFDSWHRLELQEGDRLEISGLLESDDLVLLLWDECEGTVVSCVDDAGPGEFELDNYTVPEDGTYYLQVLSLYGVEGDAFYAYKGFGETDELELTYTWVRAGTSDVVEITNTVWDFIEDEVAFDFGEGVTVTEVEVPSGTGALARVSISVDEDAPPAWRTITASQGADTAVSDTRGIAVAGLLDAPDDCAAADTAGALDTAPWQGDSTGATESVPDLGSCYGDDEPVEAGDVVHRIEVPAEGTRVWAQLTADFDAVLSLVPGCGEDDLPAVCLDRVGAGETELLDWTAGSGEAGTWYLVIDSADGFVGSYQLDLEVE